jgi:acyl-CoA thioesterase
MNDIVRARAEAMWAQDRATNGHGICHGGFIFTLADSAMAFAANPRGEPAVAQHAQITFVRPAHVGETLVADCEERMHAGRSGMYDVRVTTAAGELVAEFRGHTRTIRSKAEG